MNSAWYEHPGGRRPPEGGLTQRPEELELPGRVASRICNGGERAAGTIRHDIQPVGRPVAASFQRGGEGRTILLYPNRSSTAGMQHVGSGGMVAAVLGLPEVPCVSVLADWLLSGVQHGSGDTRS